MSGTRGELITYSAAGGYKRMARTIVLVILGIVLFLGLISFLGIVAGIIKTILFLVFNVVLSPLVLTLLIIGALILWALHR